MASAQFSSDGFDLDSMPSATGNDGGDEVVLELGGKTSTLRAADDESKELAEKAEATAKSEELKAKGNDQFKLGNYVMAVDLYSDAIEACPGAPGADLLKLQSEHEEKEREKAYQRHRKETDRRRYKSSDTGGSETPSEVEVNEDEKPTPFEPPHHEFGDKLSVYHCNRAACFLHLDRYEEAISDCDIAILLNPTYAKALLRRMTAYEKTERTEDALVDAKRALDIDPYNTNARNHVQRLQSIENERLEKLKEETMGKLKDLGNSILGNFGLSLDNFKTQKDPKTGSYNISFGNK